MLESFAPTLAISNIIVGVTLLAALAVIVLSITVIVLTVKIRRNNRARAALAALAADETPLPVSFALPRADYQGNVVAFVNTYWDSNCFEAAVGGVQACGVQDGDSNDSTDIDGTYSSTYNGVNMSTDGTDSQLIRKHFANKARDRNKR